MVLKTNTRNSLVDDVYDVLISVSCAAAFKLVLPGLGVYGGCFRGHRERTSDLRRPERVQKELSGDELAEMY